MLLQMLQKAQMSQMNRYLFDIWQLPVRDSNNNEDVQGLRLTVWVPGCRGSCLSAPLEKSMSHVSLNRSVSVPI